MDDKILGWVLEFLKLLPFLIGLVMCFCAQIYLPKEVDREKVVNLKNMADLYGGYGLPPRKVITEKGKRIYYFYYGSFVLMFISLMLVLLTRK
jgi:hypothetical protein